MGKVINIVAMQIAWFACVLGAANGVGWVGTLTSLAIAVLHVRRARQPKDELTLILSAVAIGMVLDSALASASLITFNSGVWLNGFTTHWMLALWIGFATTLNASLGWLMRSPLLAVAFGAAGGPAAYWSGQKLGALTLNAGTASFVAVGIGWAATMALFVFLVQRLNRPADERVLA